MTLDKLTTKKTKAVLTVSCPIEKYFNNDDGIKDLILRSVVGLDDSPNVLKQVISDISKEDFSLIIEAKEKVNSIILDLIWDIKLKSKELKAHNHTFI